MQLPSPLAPPDPSPAPVAIVPPAEPIMELATLESVPETNYGKEVWALEEVRVCSEAVRRPSDSPLGPRPPRGRTVIAELPSPEAEVAPAYRCYRPPMLSEVQDNAEPLCA